MSLFAGESSAPQVESQSPERSPTPQNAQNPPLVSFTLDSDEDDILDSDEEDASELESEGEPSRPNRFKGKPQTWRGYTTAERQLAASLEDLENEDLAAHLYSAHNLKRRVQKPTEQLIGLKNWETKSSWLKKGQELDFINPLGEPETELIPEKLWTAWPVPPKELPQEDSGVGQPDSEEDTWYIEGAEARDAGEVMREETLALFLRQAKESWLARDQDSVSKSRKASPRRKYRAKSEAKSSRLQSERSQSPSSDEEMHDAEDGRDYTTAASESENDEKPTNVSGKTRGRKLQPPPMKAAFLADDDEARRILQPSVNNLLSNLDTVALAIRRSRLNQSGKGANSDRSESEATSGAESAASSPERSSRSRPRKRVPKKTASKKPASRPASGSDSASSYSDTDAKGDISGSGPDGIQTRKGKGTAMKRPRTNSNSSDNSSRNRDIGERYGLMDWSEVLGLASTAGWDPQVVARTAQRCAALFGEGMSFRTFDANTSSIPEPVHYNPSTIPAPDDPATATNPTPSKRPYFDIGTLRCPHKDCWGSKQDFRIPYRTVEHVQRVHGYDPRTNDADNEERKMGGVHIDGFLQPITAKQGWLGGGRAKSAGKKATTRKGRSKAMKKPKTEEESNSVEVGDGEL